MPLSIDFFCISFLILFKTEDNVACRNAKHDKFLELAVNGDAQLIVSGDKDLLILNPFQEIAIVTVRQFLEME
jgi:uncharacterized protein